MDGLFRFHFESWCPSWYLLPFKIFTLKTFNKWQYSLLVILEMLLSHLKNNFVFHCCSSHAQAMAAIKAYAHWLLQLYTESTRTNQEKDQFNSMIVTLVECVSPLINKQVWKNKPCSNLTSFPSPWVKRSAVGFQINFFAQLQK